jgi:hypothetical protein
VKRGTYVVHLATSEDLRHTGRGGPQGSAVVPAARRVLGGNPRKAIPLSIRTKVLAAAAALTLAGGVSAVGALSATTAWAATPSCGATCVNTYPQEYAGQSLNAPQNVLDVLRQGQKIGQAIILFRASNTDPAEDFTYTNQGPASGFYAAGLLSSSLALHYGCSGTIAIPGGQIPCAAGAVDDNAFELQYSPFGVDSGLCLGVAATAVSGEGVTLQPCGISSKTTWIQDTYLNDKSPSPAGFWAAVNGSGTNFSNPLVLTYPSGANPVDKPRAGLLLKNLGQFSQGPTNDDDNQLWTAFPGELP